MKKFLVFCLTALTVLSLAACGENATQSPTEPVPSITELEPSASEQEVIDGNTNKLFIEYSEEIIQEIEEADAPLYPDEMTGSELRKLYENFARDYDWSQHNGFTSETPGTRFTYLFTEDCILWSAKRMSEVYEGSDLSCKVVYWKDGNLTEFVEYEDGAFGRSEIMEEAPIHPEDWSFFNESTVTTFLHTTNNIYTERNDKTYDVVQLKTVLDNGNSNLNLYLYVDRQTQKIELVEDQDRGTRVHFLTNATVNVTLPTNIKKEQADYNNVDILYVMQNYEHDVNRYQIGRAHV